MPDTNFHANGFDLKHIGWKTYNTVIKKAVEQEFPGNFGGLVISLSIAFFIVIISAYTLNFFHQSLQTANQHNFEWQEKVYQLETIRYLPILEENYLEYNHIQNQKQIEYRKLLYTKSLLV